MSTHTATPRAPEAPVLRLRDPGDVVAYVPHLFGFVPSDSLVLLVVAGRDLALAARLDLRAVLSAPPADLFTDLLWQGRVHGAGRVIAVVCAPQRRARRIHGIVRRGLGAWLDFCVVADYAAGFWWPGQAAGDAAGEPILADPALAEWSRRHGRTPVAACRSDLLAGVRPPTGEREDELVALWAATEADLRERDPDEWLAAMDSYLAAPEAEWTDADYVTAGLLAHQGFVRDRLWRHVTRANARALFTFWSGVVRRTPPAQRVVPLAIAGLLAWQAGEGAMLSVIHEECRRLNPAAPVVGLLDAIRRRHVHPDAWPEERDRWEADATLAGLVQAA
jgi:hypothetical protein